VKRPLDEIEAFRAQELLFQRATEGLTDAEAAELSALGADDDYSFDLAAAAIDLATIQPEQMPAGLADKVLVAAGVKPAMPSTLAGVVPPRSIQTSAVKPDRSAELPVSRPEAPIIPITRRRSSVVIAWAAAAAAFVFAIGTVLWATQREGTEVVENPKNGTKQPTLAEQRTELLKAADVKTLAWSATGDAAAKDAKGDVVWSPSKQEGYMRFVGLAPNDPKITQYQLWIFDKNRDEKFPVDGGVFDVTATGEVIVKIESKLFVTEPVLWAVTVEKPGGVVVSARERIVVVAKPG
jgi:hypothetical protein